MTKIYKCYSTKSTSPIVITQKWSEVAQSCPTLCDPIVCSLWGSSVHGISQARILEWVAISFSRGSSWPRDQTWVSCIVGRHFTVWATREIEQCVNLFSPGWAVFYLVLILYCIKYLISVPDIWILSCISIRILILWYCI